MSTQSQLLALASVDKDIAVSSERRKTLEQRRKADLSRMESERSKLAVATESHEKARSALAEEEVRLKEEERKIIERRKALGELGTKSARIGEREVDIAARAMNALEEKVLTRMQEVERRKFDMEKQIAVVDVLEVTISAEHPPLEAEVQELEGIIADRERERVGVASAIEQGALRLYDRVRQRYPAEPVAIAKGNCCQVCYRSLPLQVVNQLMTPTTVLNCPGCSRILIYQEEQPADQS